ncbi:MAG: lipoprotein signal peptidase [Bacteroidetes bacterium]|nr:lipoprotein signal peptidase [Bacteroidota bacterium]MDA0922488.1 lipoprotein signal peptidase [Bacteroidota bacterium]MDA1288581.1 lipoprotein signal peptidase [Bacteroidota bacterium]
MTPSIKSKTSYFTLRCALAVIVGVLLLDQCSKFYIKLNYPLSGYGVPPILDWGFFKILFVENSGMAMGTQLNDILPFINDEFAKLILTLFRLIAIGGLGYWLWNTLKKQDALLLSWALSLIFAGALGNIIDSVFYGVIFTDSYRTIATLFPEQGYAPLFFGHVVDMLQFPLVEWDWPEWVPFVGGDHFLFFQYIFNIADVAISTGVGILIVFNKKIFSKLEQSDESLEE